MTGELPEFEEKSPQIALEELGKLKNELESGEFKLGEFLYEVEHEIISIEDEKGIQHTKPTGRTIKTITITVANRLTR